MLRSQRGKKGRTTFGVRSQKQSNPRVEKEWGGGIASQKVPRVDPGGRGSYAATFCKRGGKKRPLGKAKRTTAIMKKESTIATKKTRKSRVSNWGREEKDEYGSENNRKKKEHSKGEGKRK